MGVGGKKGKGKGKKKKKMVKGTFVKNIDMESEMKNTVLECFEHALTIYNSEMDLAAYVKKHFDIKYGPSWHCVVGRQFGSNITYQVRNYIHVFVNQFAVLLFKT